MTTRTITPCLWFADGADDALAFYGALFGDDFSVDHLQRGPDGKVFLATFTLAGQRYQILQAGPHFRLNEAFSLFVLCTDQAEVDRLWAALVEGGRPSRCGWLTDRFGVTWQIVPPELPRTVGGPDPERAARARTAMLAMEKLDGPALQRAYDGP